MNEYSKQFRYWYERIYLQSPRMCSLEYDDEKMWEAWTAGYKEGMMAGSKLKEILAEESNEIQSD